MTRSPSEDEGPLVTPLSLATDFYVAWANVDRLSHYSSTARARAFAVWVSLFGSVDADGVVLLNSAEISEQFTVSRASWVQYRELLELADLIEQTPVRGSAHQRMVVKLTPPLRTA